MCELAEASSPAIVYFHGYGGGKAQWYHVEFKGKNPPIKVSPVAILGESTVGTAGSWTFCGDSIYWCGGYTFVDGKRRFVSDLLKHNIHDPHPENWVVENTLPTPHGISFMASDLATKMLYFVGGLVNHTPPDATFGERYDLVSKTWSVLQGRDTIKGYKACLVLKEDRTEIVFYSLDSGSVQFLDLTGGGILSPVQVHSCLALTNWKSCNPPDGFLDINEVHSLVRHSNNRPAMFYDNTFYWFNLDMRLIGYDIGASRWYQSPTLSHLPPLSTDPYEYPVLLGLGNSDMLVIIPTTPRELTIACLRVEKTSLDLNVSVESTQAYCFDNSFLLHGGMAILRFAYIDSFQTSLVRFFWVWGLGSCLCE